MFAELALVHFGIAADAVAIVTVFADAIVARGLLAINGRLGDTLGVLVAIVFVIGAIVGLVTRVLSQLLEVKTELVLPSLVAFLLDLGDDRLERVSPITRGLIIGIVNEATANVAGIIVAHDRTIAHGRLAQLGQLGGDGLPGGDGLLDAIGGFEGDLLEFGIGK